MRIGLLTGGGDAPGLNSVIEATTRVLLNAGHSVVGIQDGFEGVFESKFQKLDLKTLYGIHGKAGTILGTSSRCGIQGREDEFYQKYQSLQLDGLIVAGGDGTFRSLKPFENKIPILGIPKTIDNDLPGTEATFGYDTACSVVSKAVDALRATSQAHRRILVVETMGRTAGWIALGGGLASYADVILIPERKLNLPNLLNFLQEKHRTQRGLIVVVSEGVVLDEGVHRTQDASGESLYVHDYGAGKRLAQWIDSQVEWEARAVVLGHLQRSEPPTTTDRFLTAAMGATAAQMVLRNQWNQAVVYRQGQVTSAPLSDVMGPPRSVAPDHRWVLMAQSMGLYI